MAEVVLVEESVVANVADLVVIDDDGLEAGEKGEDAKGFDPVPACVEVVELEAVLEAVVVLHAVDLVVVDVQATERVWHEGVVEPVELVGGDVEVLQVHLVGEQAVDVLHLVLGQVKEGQVAEGREAALVEGLQPVL